MCLNDFAVMQSGGLYHLLHLQGPWTPVFDERAMETSYGHATSHDLVEWRTQAPCFGVSAPGSFDSSAVWTMHPFPVRDGVVAMAYTGVNARPWAEQAIGMAITGEDDATGWMRMSRDSVVRADPRWYRTEHPMAWRDPFVVENPEGGWAMVVCAASAEHPVGSAGCVGFATSHDLLEWDVQPPLILPGDVDEFECPVLETTPDGWLLLGSIASSHQIEAWRSPALTGPWERLGPIAPAGPYAPRLVTGPDGRRLLLHTVQRRTQLTDSGAPCRGMLAQPKVFDLSVPAEPRLTWWRGNETHLEEDWAVRAGDGMALVDSTRPGSLPLREDGGLVLSWNGTRVSVGCEETTLRSPAAVLRLLLVGEYVEVYADDVLVLSVVNYEPRGVLPVPIRPLKPIGAARDDVSALRLTSTRHLSRVCG
nr:hypothetical protein [Lentzea sp. HUAS12]